MKTIKHKILIVDDELDFLDNIVNIFESTESDFEVLQANNINLAIEIIKLESPDLILTDWEMPNVSGLELVKFVKLNKKFKHIPIILCTGKKTSFENLQTAFEIGVNDFIRKPFDKIELILRVRSMLILTESIKKNIKQRHKLIKLESQLIIEKLNNIENLVINSDKKIDISDNHLQKNNIKLIEIKNAVENFYENKNCLECKKIKQKIDKIINNEDFIRLNLESDFIQNLKKQNPILSVSDLKLCYFIYQNYSTKEIANVLNVQSNSINIARYRIRKKLNLNKSANLNDYFKNL